MSFVPYKGNTLCTLTGGPWDKLGIWFDADHSPKILTMDGHAYERYVQSWRAEDGYFCDDFDIYYNYKGKQS